MLHAMRQRWGGPVVSCRQPLFGLMRGSRGGGLGVLTHGSACRQKREDGGSGRGRMGAMWVHGWRVDNGPWQSVPVAACMASLPCAMAP